ncbi:hypothetical protein A5649_13430 [Mycolicibacter heraklionensis]|uniref:DUF732 domain-containing protein n=1 Tax=Mycolicibacter heraklionensis TaxID=512402 RepID=A0AA91EYI3_9MYCO|nr:DUF732 domain-containing protein [Mycolicibacter heraklionensis]OBK89448.1 hypothetical protein A5649_13430 [Mycolicibacter heraklionensis]
MDPETAAAPTSEVVAGELAWGAEAEPVEIAAGPSWRLVVSLAASIVVSAVLLVGAVWSWTHQVASESASESLRGTTTSASAIEPPVTPPPPPSTTTVVAAPPVTVTVTPPPAAPAVPSPPAHSGVDAAFLAEAHAAGTVSSAGDDDTIDLAHVVCGDPTDGLTLQEEADVLQRATGWSAPAARSFVYIAVTHYCPTRGR